MATANKFPTMIQSSTNSRMADILVYTLLEWMLISLLFLNTLLSYAVARFAAFFGLKPPCVLCSTFLAAYRTYICDRHAAEISKLAYCSAHRKLAEAAEMCADCSCSASSATALMLTWMKRSEEGGNLDLRCSCCHVSLESGFYSAPPWLLKSNLAEKAIHLFGEQQEEVEQLIEGDEGTKAVDDQSLETLSNNDVKILDYECCVERVIPVEIDHSDRLAELLETDLMVVNSGRTSEEMEPVQDTEFVDEIVAAGEMIDFSILKEDKDIKFEGMTCFAFALHDNELAGEVSIPREAEDIDGSQRLTVDHLKTVLKAERRALRSLYSELEEERSASAIAANQTMAMITRLQEEKAAMQMEAVQYQRMMEEQSEYDQEALQLLHELMVKREKEKQEMEMELEIYRERVLIYEARERRKITSSADDGDDLSDVNRNDEYSDHACVQNIQADNAVLDSETQHMIIVDESLADFEEERVAIMGQLKSMEEKLFFLDDVNRVNGHYKSSGDDLKFNRLLDTLNSKEIMFRSDERNVDFRGKQLLPLFDAAGMDDEEILQIQQKLAISQEVDNVYERLQALEADQEFLRHCISSLKKGDEGNFLLQEILQHLRDLRSVH